LKFAEFMDSKCQTTTMLLPLSALNGRDRYLHQTSRKKKKQQEDVKLQETVC
jgi:hypothetical protein